MPTAGTGGFFTGGSFFSFFSFAGENEMLCQNLLLLLPSLLLLRKSFRNTHRFELLPADEHLEELADPDGVVSASFPF